MKKLLVLSLLAACGGTPAPKSGAGPIGGDSPNPGDPPATPTEAAQPAPAVATGKPKSDLIPRSVLFGNPERTAVRISPDGKTLSWIAPKDGVLNIWVAPVGKLDQAKAITSDTERPIRQYFWAYTSKHVVYSQDTAGDENFHLFRADIADGKTTELTPYKGARAELLETNPRFPTKLLVNINDRDPQVFDLFEVDLLTGKRTLVVQNDQAFVGFTVDHDMKVRAAVKKLPDGSTQVMVPDGKGKDDRASWKPFETIPFEDAETTNIIGFEPGNKAVYLTETRGRDTAALVSLDLATKKQKVLAEDAKADAGGIMVHPTKHHVQAVAFEYDRQRWQVLDKSIETTSRRSPRSTAARSSSIAHPRRQDLGRRDDLGAAPAAVLPVETARRRRRRSCWPRGPSSRSSRS